MTQTNSTPKRKPRTLSLIHKGLSVYKFESSDYLIFTIQKNQFGWNLEVDSTFRKVFQGGQMEYLGGFSFQTLREAKLFATVYSAHKHS